MPTMHIANNSDIKEPADNEKPEDSPESQTEPIIRTLPLTQILLTHKEMVHTYKVSIHVVSRITFVSFMP